MQNKSYIHQKRKKSSPSELFEGIKKGDFVALSYGITLCESQKAEDRLAANELVKLCLPLSGNSIRIGITGVPGVGKSTFIEAFGLYLIEKERKKVAVLAVDPSSQRSKGSILGDKTRMERLSNSPSAFIRPSPTSGSLGGVTNQSRESIILCEAAGFEVILVETVGVGQSETEVREMTDFFLLLMLAGAGDELQGIKRGIMEMADGILINKAEGENRLAAKMAAREYRNALHLFPRAESKWTTRVELCSALHGENMDVAWQIVDEYVKLTLENGFLQLQRRRQLRSWFRKTIDELIKSNLFSAPKIKSKIQELEEAVEEKRISSYEAAEEVIEMMRK